jgi:hypothetical protein
LTATSPRITIFCGRFGSGKTEIALNYALRLADRGELPLLIDLDIVTPYFRTRDKGAEMAEHGVELVAPFEAGRHMHMPALSPRILGAIQQSARPVVIDLGGDEQGTHALAQFAPTIARHGYAMYMVANPYRPFMGTVDGIREAVQAIGAHAGLSVSALISNPNMMGESTPDLFWEGHRLIKEAAHVLRTPVAFAVVSQTLAGQLEWDRSEWQPVGGDKLGLDGSLFAGRICVAMDHEISWVLVIHRFFPMFDDMG